MRGLRVRFTVRRIMVAVAFAGLILGADGLRRRSLALSYRADSHAIRRSRLVEDEFTMSTAAAKHRDLAPVKDEATRRRYRQLADEEERHASALRRSAERHLALEVKYRDDARHPWRRVAPDPPGDGER